MSNLCLLVGTLPNCGAKLVVLFFDFVFVSKMMINNNKNLAKFGYKGDMKSKTLKHLSILSLKPTKNHIYKSADFYANSLKIW